MFEDEGVMDIENDEFDGIEKLEMVKGGEIVYKFDNNEIVKMGNCDVIEKVMIGEDKMISFGGVELGED
jgi:T-complex protein 1 subunit beta